MQAASEFISGDKDSSEVESSDAAEDASDYLLSEENEDTEDHGEACFYPLYSVSKLHL